MESIHPKQYDYQSKFPNNCQHFLPILQIGHTIQSTETINNGRTSQLIFIGLMIIWLIIIIIPDSYAQTEAVSLQVLSTDVYIENIDIGEIDLGIPLPDIGEEDRYEIVLKYGFSFKYSIYAGPNLISDMTLDSVGFDAYLEAFSASEGLWRFVGPVWLLHNNGLSGQITVTPGDVGIWTVLLSNKDAIAIDSSNINTGNISFLPGTPLDADWYVIGTSWSNAYDLRLFYPSKFRLHFNCNGSLYYGNRLDPDFVSVNKDWYAELDVSLPDPDNLPDPDSGLQQIYHGGPQDKNTVYFDQLLDCAPCAGLGMPIISVNSSTRNLVIQDTDFTYGTFDPKVYLTRTYNENSNQIGMFGRGWTSNFERSVREQDDLSVHIRGGSGGLNIYTYNSDGSYTPPFGLFDTLEKNDDGSWKLIEKTSRIMHNFTPSGRLLSTEDRNGNKVEYNYSGDNLTSISGPTGGLTTLNYNSSDRVESLFDPNGNSAIFQYDANGNLIKYIDMLGTEITYTYDSSSHLLSMTTPKGQWNITGQTGTANIFQVASITDPAGNTRNYQAGSQENEGKIVDQDGRNFTYEFGPNMETTAITSPANGRTEFEYNESGKLIRIKDPENRITYIEYDSRNNPVRLTDPAGEQVTIQYNSEDFPIRSTDQLGNVTRFEYDSNNNLTKIVDSLGQETRINNNTKGLPTQLTNPGGQSTGFIYDFQGNLKHITDPLGNFVELDYNATGKIISKTDANGTTATIEYDELDRITKLNYPDGTIEYEYNCCLLEKAIAKDGRQLILESDNLNRLVRYTDLNSFITSFEYDKSGKLISLVYPGQRTVSYGYDASGRINSVTDWLGNQATYSYDQSGKLLEENLPNGTKTQYEYTSSGRLKALRNIGISGVPLPQFNYERDKVGKIVSVSTVNYHQPPPSIENTSYSYNPDDSLLSSGSNSSFEYDKNGNLIKNNTSSGTLTYTYGYDNRLTRLVTPTHSYEYEYDPQGFRVSRQIDGEKALYAGPGIVLLKANASMQPTDYYIYAQGLAWRIDAATNEAFFYHFDSRGSTVAVTDEQGDKVAAYIYGPFGELISSEGAEWNPYKYVGKYGVEDEGNGLLFMRNRYYHPETGKFISRDPIGFYGGLNLYAYTSNDPVNFIDPAGLDFFETAKDGAFRMKDAVEFAVSSASGAGTALMIGTALVASGPVTLVTLGLGTAAAFVVGGYSGYGICEGVEIAHDFYTSMSINRPIAQLKGMED